MTRILVLRPEPGATETVERAREMGLGAVKLPLFRVKPVEFSIPDAASFDGLLLTSANAVRCAGDRLQELRGLKAYAVGDATADAAREAGFGVAATGDAGVDRLLGSIEPDLKLLHLCGEDRREPRDAKQQITRLAVYRAEALDDPDLSEAGGSVVLVHSPRAGKRFAELVRDRAATGIVAISDAAAEAVGDGWKSVDVADRPDDEAMLALAASLCEKPDPK